jgi:hypothetical protein
VPELVAQLEISRADGDKTQPAQKRRAHTPSDMMAFFIFLPPISILGPTELVYNSSDHLPNDSD